MIEDRMGSRMGRAGAVLTVVAVCGAAGCASTEYVGNGAKGFWSESSAQVAPNEAFRKAMPHLPATWEARCEKVRHHDKWCDQAPLDHMVRRGSYYYVTRTSYPYKSYDAFLQYAVRVHADTGEVIPLQ